MAQKLKPLRLMPDADSGLEPIDLLPDHRDMYLLREFTQARGWPENIQEDPIRQTYAMAYLCAIRTGKLPPATDFDTWWPKYDIDDPGGEFETAPTQPAT